MKKYLIILVLIMSNSLFIYSQTGSTCVTPDTIHSLPFVSTGHTTAGFGNNYTATDLCISSYTSGNDYVFMYKPTSDIHLRIKVTVPSNQYLSGVFVNKNCPGSIQSVCIVNATVSSGNVEILNAPLLADSTYFIIVTPNNAYNMNPNMIFDIEIRESFQYDLAAYQYYSPRSKCGLHNSESIYYEVINQGYDTINSFNLAYNIDGGSTFTENIIHTMLPGETYYHHFNNYSDLSIVGHTYDIKVYSTYNLDQNLNNDTFNINITNLNTITTFPYYDNFESGAGGWVTEVNYKYSRPNTPTSWELGLPNKNTINSASSGVNAWVTSIDTNYNTGEWSYLLSPCFDLSGMTLPVVEFDIWYESDTYDRLNLEYSKDFDGLIYEPVGTINEGNNWYNSPSSSSREGWTGSSGGWIHAKHTLDSLAGHANAKLCFFLKGTNACEGFAVDNIEIHESPFKDIGVIQVLSPIDDCGHTNSEEIKVKIFNYGLDTIFSFPLSYSLNGSAFVTETVNDTIAFNQSITYTFTSTIDISTIADYQLIVKTELPLDEATNNDSITFNFTSFENITSLPYLEDFESNNGNWFVKGDNSSWAWGQPTDSIINSAASGNNVWATNLSGYYNDLEQSYLVGPCFDLSTVINPYVKLKVWHETVNPSGAQLESSIDNGATWQVVGVSATVDTNWYTSGYMWLGKYGGWKNTKQSISNLIGNSDVQFRIKFNGVIQETGVAIDDFEICDAPKASFTVANSGNNFDFTNTSVNGNTYLWVFSDGTTYSTTNISYHITSDSVSCKLYVSNDCNIDSTNKYTIYNTAINSFKTEIGLFPNPVNKTLNIKINNNNYSLTIFNLEGEKLEEYNNIDDNKINVQNLKSGYYIIRVITENKIYTGSFVKN